MIFAGGALGTGLRVFLFDFMGEDVATLALINLFGCVLLGFVAGIYGQQVTLLRLFLAVGGLASFTSWSTLALQSLHPWGVVVAAVETALGVGAAGIGHLAGRLKRVQPWSG